MSVADGLDGTGGLVAVYEACTDGSPVAASCRAALSSADEAFREAAFDLARDALGALETAVRAHCPGGMPLCGSCMRLWTAHWILAVLQAGVNRDQQQVHEALPNLILGLEWLRESGMPIARLLGVERAS